MVTCLAGNLVTMAEEQKPTPDMEQATERNQEEEVTREPASQDCEKEQEQEQEQEHAAGEESETEEEPEAEQPAKELEKEQEEKDDPDAMSDDPMEGEEEFDSSLEFQGQLATISDTSLPLADRLSKTLQLLQEEGRLLQESSLKDYERLEHLKDALTCATYIGEEFESNVAGMCRDMGGVREALEDIQASVDKKLTNEGLMSWLSGPAAHPAGKINDWKPYL